MSDNNRDTEIGNRFPAAGFLTEDKDFAVTRIYHFFL